MKGFTLVEKLIALSIVVIASLIAIPYFMDRESEVKVLLVKAQLLELLQQAQKMANSQFISIKVCLSNDGVICTMQNSRMILLKQDEKILNSSFIKGRGTLYLRSYPENHNYISILPTIVGKSDNGTFWYCRDNALQWAITVSQSGEPRFIPAIGGVLDDPSLGKLDC